MILTILNPLYLFPPVLNLSNLHHIANILERNNLFIIVIANLISPWILIRGYVRIEALLKQIIKWKLQLLKLRKVAMYGFLKLFTRIIITLFLFLRAHTYRFANNTRIRLLSKEIQMIREL